MTHNDPYKAKLASGEREYDLLEAIRLPRIDAMLLERWRGNRAAR